MSSFLFTFFKFALVGLFNSVLDTTLWKLISNWILTKPKLLNWLQDRKLNAYSGAQVLSFMVALTSSFFMNSTFTWAKSPFESWGRAISYLVVSIITWTVTVFYINLLTNQKLTNTINPYFEKMNKNLNLSPKMAKILDYPLVVKISSIALSMMINFIGYQFFVFAN
jgi:putative flippase GtrA